MQGLIGLGCPRSCWYLFSLVCFSGDVLFFPCPETYAFGVRSTKNTTDFCMFAEIYLLCLQHQNDC